MIFNRLGGLFTFIFIVSAGLLSSCGGDGDSARLAQTIDAGANKITAIKLDVGVSANDGYVHAFGNRQFNLTGLDSDNTEFSLNNKASWTIGESTLGSINSSGFFTPSGSAGDFMLKVSYAGLEIEEKIIVTDAPLQNIAVSNTESSVDVCKNTTFTGTATFEGGLVLNFPLVWGFSDVPSAELASFEDTSLPTMSTRKSGNVRVVATGTVGTASPVESNEFIFPINDSLTSITLAASGTTSLRTNQTTNLTATGVYSGSSNTNITANTSFVSSNTAVLTVDAAGVVTAKTGSFSGTPVTVTATCNEVSGTLVFTVLRTEVRTIAIIGPSNENATESLPITIGNSLDLRIKATLDDTAGTTEIYTQDDVEWAIDSKPSSVSDSDVTLDPITGVITVSADLQIFQDIFLVVSTRIKNSDGTTKLNPSGQELKDTIQIVVKA